MIYISDRDIKKEKRERTVSGSNPRKLLTGLGSPIDSEASSVSSSCSEPTNQ